MPKYCSICLYNLLYWTYMVYLSICTVNILMLHIADIYCSPNTLFISKVVAGQPHQWISHWISKKSLVSGTIGFVFFLIHLKSCIAAMFCL